MKTVMIIPNTLKKQSVDFTKKAIDYLTKKGYMTKVILSDKDEIVEDAEFALVLGGDGTILRSAKKLYKYDTLIFGINFGHMGYLTEVDSKDAFAGIDKLISSDYHVEERIMIEGEVTREGKEIYNFIALNDVNISRSTLLHAIRMNLFINSKPIESIFGDSVIVSTPTGSTSYNFSAGGPVLTPTSDNIVITPVCPQFSPHTSIVADGTDTISVSISYDKRFDDGDACIEIDGGERFVIENEDIVTIRKSKYKTRIAKITDKSFYQVLREKISSNNN